MTIGGHRLLSWLDQAPRSSDPVPIRSNVERKRPVRSPFAPNDPDVAREVLVHFNPHGGSMFLYMKVFESSSRDQVILRSIETGASDHAVRKYLEKTMFDQFVRLDVCVGVFACPSA